MNRPSTIVAAVIALMIAMPAFSREKPKAKPATDGAQARVHGNVGLPLIDDSHPYATQITYNAPSGNSVSVGRDAHQTPANNESIQTMSNYFSLDDHGDTLMWLTKTLPIQPSEFEGKMIAAVKNLNEYESAIAAAKDTKISSNPKERTQYYFAIQYIHEARDQKKGGGEGKGLDLDTLRANVSLMKRTRNAKLPGGYEFQMIANGETDAFRTTEVNSVGTALGAKIEEISTFASKKVEAELDQAQTARAIREAGAALPGIGKVEDNDATGANI